MDIEEDWILFLERNPQYFEITKGGFFMPILESISEGTKTREELLKLSSEVTMDDVYSVIKKLVELKLVSKSRTSSQTLYAISEEGERLLEVYTKTKKFFSA